MCREKKSGTSPPLEIFDQVQICSGQDLMSNPCLERWTVFGVDCIIVKQSASMSLVCLHLDKSHLWSRAPFFCRENALNSICLVLRVEPSRLIIRQRCRGMTTPDLLCRLTRLFGKLQQPVPLLSQAHAFTASRECSNQLSFTVECDRRLFSDRR